MRCRGVVGAMALIMMLCAGTLALAQDAGGRRAGRGMGPMSPEMKQKRIDMYVKQLNLTDDQKTKLSAILDTQDQKMKDLMANKDLTREQRRTEMQKIHQETVDEINKILTPAQQDAYKKWQEEQQKRMEEMRNRQKGQGNQ